MHATALLTAMVTHGLIMPPVEKHRSYHLEAARPAYAIKELLAVPEPLGFSHLVGSGNWDIGANVPKDGWKDGDAFKKPLPYALIMFTFDPFWGIKDPRNGPIYQIDVIGCEDEKEAKEIFLQLRLRRVPNYARSGKFLIHATPTAFDWFVSIYGADRYSIKRTVAIW